MGDKETKKLLEEVKASNKPSAAEAKAVERVANSITERLEKALKSCRIKAKAAVGGSGAKGTWLRGMHDIDVFVCFDYTRYKEKSGELSEILAAAVKKAFPKHERLHGSRDYFKIQSKGCNFELVPILRIKNARQALNITDVSLLHSGWVKRKIGKNKQTSLADEIRLTKAFCKACRAYGAESYVRGFSGYACEVLTAYYGSFLKLITSAALNWKKQITAGKKIVVDAEMHYRRRDPLRELNQAKVQSSLVAIDPVQPDRNATAALSNETLAGFIAAAERFLKKPSKDAFEREEITAEKLMQKAGKNKKLVIVEAEPVKAKEDVAGAKLVKAFEHILLKLQENGFEVNGSGWEWNKNMKRDALLWYFIGKKEPEAEERAGPPLSNNLHADNFRKEHSGKSGRQLLEKKGRLHVKIERAYRQPQQLISALLAEDAYLKGKAQRYSARSFG
ncbi:CCA tRNA nucleotidyltransferase [Candidatus Woesearchaeota archaeon]|nr:CCA tRNA nucleotidyltransferase [Candidatus Woesearchaeota archaeon]